jgi:hypothetical protein
VVHGSIRLNLARPLVKTWLGVDVARCTSRLAHLGAPLFGVVVYQL